MRVKDVSIEDLIDLVAADVPGVEDRLQKMFEWRFSRDVEVAKWVLGAAASFVVAIGVALFNAATLPSWPMLIFLLGLPLGVGSYGFLRVVQMRNVHRQYLAALKITAHLRSVRPFLLRYRKVVRNG